MCRMSLRISRGEFQKTHFGRKGWIVVLWGKYKHISSIHLNRLLTATLEDSLCPTAWASETINILTKEPVGAGDAGAGLRPLELRHPCCRWVGAEMNHDLGSWHFPPDCKHPESSAGPPTLSGVCYSPFLIIVRSIECT